MTRTLFIFAISISLSIHVQAQCRLDYSNYTPVFTETFDGMDSIGQLSPAWRFWYPNDSAHGPYYGWLSEIWSRKNISFLHEGGKDFIRLSAKRLPQPAHCNDCPDLGNYKGDKKYVSGMLELVAGEDSMAGFTYGIFEANIRLPFGAGAWPAFWMVGPEQNHSLTEIDIIDGYFSNERIWKTNVLDWSNGQAKGFLVENKQKDDDLSLNFHLYSMVWTPQKLAFFLDGKELFSFSNPVENKDKISGTVQTVYTRPEKLITLLTMQMADWANLDSAHMDIDYVKIYKPCIIQNGKCKPPSALTAYDYNNSSYISCDK